MLGPVMMATRFSPVSIRVSLGTKGAPESICSTTRVPALVDFNLVGEVHLRPAVAPLGGHSGERSEHVHLATAPAERWISPTPGRRPSPRTRQKI